MRKRRKKSIRTLVGTCHIVSSPTGEQLSIKLLDTERIRDLETIKLTDLTRVDLSSDDYLIIFPTSARGQQLGVFVGPP